MAIDQAEIRLDETKPGKAGQQGRLGTLQPVGVQAEQRQLVAAPDPLRNCA